MNVRVSVDTKGLSVQTISDKVVNNRVGTFAAKEAKRLFNPFTPQRDKKLVDNVIYRPWEIEYFSLHAKPMYDGYRRTKKGKTVHFKYRTDFAPYASKQWDKAAISAGRGEQLAKTVEEFIKKQL